MRYIAHRFECPAAVVSCLKHGAPDTNGVMEHFSVNTRCVAAGVDRLIKRHGHQVPSSGASNILVISPLAIPNGGESGSLRGTMSNGRAEKSRQPAAEYCLICELRDVHFPEADDIVFQLNRRDFIYLTRMGHTVSANTPATPFCPADDRFP